MFNLQQCKKLLFNWNPKNMPLAYTESIIRNSLWASVLHCYKDVVEGIFPRIIECPLPVDPWEKFLFVLNRNSHAAPEQLAHLILWMLRSCNSLHLSLAGSAPKGLDPNLWPFPGKWAEIIYHVFCILNFLFSLLLIFLCPDFLTHLFFHFSLSYCRACIFYKWP